MYLLDHKELYRRNARLRAYVDLGMLRAGVWSIVERPGGAGMRAWWFEVYLVCGRSDCGAAGRMHDVVDANGPPRGDRTERGVLRACVERMMCPHLAPLYEGEDPPEVVELTKLELLAGE